MGKQKLFVEITDGYSAMILNWAVKKTGSRPDGEDLAQEVLLQVFLAVTKQEKIDKLENFIWKVAHYVWCNRVRELSNSNFEVLDEVLSDGTDFTADFTNSETLNFELVRMRKNIANLSFIQREAMIQHYLDNISVTEVAKRLNTTESAITWHLFDARKKVKKELVNMKDNNSYIYRPGRLSLGGSGGFPMNADTNKVNESLIKQNLCLLCYNEGKTINDLIEMTGIPKPYIEYDLDWLVNREFLSLDGRKYSTIFPIIGKKHYQFIGDLYKNTRKDYIDKIIEFLWANEDKIKAVRFYGSAFPLEKIMWSMIMMFTSYVSRNSELLLKLKKRDEREIRPDGGKYYIVACDLSENQGENPNGYFKPKGWGGYYGICSDNCATQGKHDTYYWLGVYNFIAEEYHPKIIDSSNVQMQQMLYKLYCNIIEPNFHADNLSADEKEKLAQAVQNKMITKYGESYKPNFIIMTSEQLAKIQTEIFAPLLAMITPKMSELSEVITKLHKANMPKINKGYIDYYTYVDLWTFGIYTLIFAAEDKKLYLPDTPEEGTPLTLVIIK